MWVLTLVLIMNLSGEVYHIKLATFEGADGAEECARQAEDVAQAMADAYPLDKDRLIFTCTLEGKQV